MPAFTQQLDASTVRRETLDGTEYAVAPVNILKPMALNAPAGWDVDEAYLPRKEAQASAPLWNGTPLTLNHPTANGTGTTANSPQMHERSVMGRVFNATFDESEGFVRGEAWFDIDKARSMGGPAEAALDRVLNGETVEVSSGYRPSRLPSGEYDGAARTAVQGEIRPDHVAVLPNTEGKCSVDAEGCGVGAAVANELAVTNAALAPDVSDETPDAETDISTTDATADGGDDASPDTDDADTTAPAEDDGLATNPSVGGISYSGTAGGTLDESAIPNDDYESHYVFDAETKSESSFPLVDAEGQLRAGNVAAAFRFRDDAPDTSALLDVLETVNGAFDDPPIEPESLEDALSSNAADGTSDASSASGAGMIDWLRGFLGAGSASDGTSDGETVEDGEAADSAETRPAESGEDIPAAAANADGGTDSMDNRDELIDEITANSPITAASLEDACDERVELLHGDVVSANETDEEEDEADEVEATNDGEFQALRESINDLTATVGEMQDEMITEADLAENERADLVDDILANSDEYGEEDREELESTPEAVLNRIHDDVTEPSPAANFAAARGASAAPATNEDTPDADDLVMFEGDL